MALCGGLGEVQDATPDIQNIVDEVIKPERNCRLRNFLWSVCKKWERCPDLSQQR